MIDNENDALYEEQESQLAARSSAFVEFLQRRGLLDGSKIDDEKIRQAKKEYIQRVHHNTRLLMENYRMIRWVLECCPDEIAAELDAPMGDLDALMDKIDLHLCLEDKKLEGRINAIAKTRVLMDRVNEALTILRRKPIDGQQLYDLLYVSYIQDEQLTNIDICHQLHMSSRTYYRLRREAFKIIGRAGNVFRGGGNIGGGPGAAGQGFAAGFASRFSPNSYVRDAVVQGGQRMGFGGGAGFFARAFGGIAARNGATLNSTSISSVATRAPNASGTIAGDIADRSLGNYMPHMQGFQLQGTQITGGHITTTAIGADGKTSTVEMFNAAQFEKPDVPHGVVTASDGSSWYQMASGEGRGAFYDAPVFNGPGADAAPSSAQFGAGSPDGTSDVPQGSSVAVEGGGENIVVPGTVVDAPAGGVLITDGPGEVSADGSSSVVGDGYAPNQMPGDMPGDAVGGVVGDSYGPNQIPGDMPGDGIGGAVGDGYGPNAIPGYPMGDAAGDFSGDAGGVYGGYSEAPLVAATFPGAPEGTMLRTVDDGVLEASTPDGGNTLWYNSAYFEEPDAPHSVIQSANGVDWYAIQQHADVPQFEPGEDAAAYNQAAFQQFMPGYEPQISQVDGSHREDGHFEVRNADGSGTAFYDVSKYAAPRGDYQVFEDAQGSQWYAIRGEAAVERKPVFQDGKPVYDGDSVRTVSVDTVRYKQTPSRFADPDRRGDIERKPPRRKM